MRSFLRAFIIFLVSSSVFAGSQPPKLDSITDIPVKRIKAVETNGEILFMSENGRYVFQGQLTDTWHKTSLDTVAEVKYSASHIDIALMGLPINDMNTITLGSGPKQIVVFVDPLCKYCKKFIKEAKPYEDEYTFKLVVVPALGKESHKLSKNLFCSKDKSSALEAYMNNTLSLLPQSEQCDPKFYDLTLTFAQLIGVDAVPYFIAPDGRYKAGQGMDFWEWVKRNG